jgi:hypothetical protein
MKPPSLILGLRKFSALGLITALTLSIASYGHSPCTPLLLGGTPIPLEALEAIHQAKSNYEIEVVTKMVDGKPRVVIFAGETHLKRDPSSKVGLNLLRHFDFKGLEGANLSKNGIAGAILSPVLDSIHFIAQKFFRMKGSSIDDADQALELSIAKNEYAWQLASSMKAKEGKSSISLSVEEEDTLKNNLGLIEFKAQGQSETQSFNGSEIISPLKRYLADESGVLKRPVNLQLEKGHVPSTRENLGLLELPANLTLVGLGLGLPHFTGQGNAVVDATSALVTLITFVGTAYTFTGMGLKKRHETKKWYKVIFPLQSALLDGRNETMVRNIDAGFAENPDHDQMLVVVGRAHVKGMKALLIESYGYSPAIIPDKVSTESQDRPHP